MGKASAADSRQSLLMLITVHVDEAVPPVIVSVSPTDDADDIARFAIASITFAEVRVIS